MKMKYNFYKIIVLFIALLTIGTDVVGQTAQTINPNGGASANLDDGLKILLHTTGALSVYRNNQTQYYNGYTWPNHDANRAVILNFRFDDGTTFNTTSRTIRACSTTPAQQNGNNWTTSISGYVDSPISGARFFVTMNFQYTHPQRYFLVDYYIRAPFDLVTPETVHLYLNHDAYILGFDSSRGYRTQNATGEFVGDYRDANDNISGCDNRSNKNPHFPSTHGFKTRGGFRSYYSGPFSPRNIINNSTLELSNTVGTACIDDGIAVEFTIGPLSAGQVGTRQVLHGYGNERGEFDNTVVNDPIPPTGLSSPVSVNFTSTAFSEAEGDNSHPANNIQIEVGSGRLAQDQICNFSVVAGGTAVQNTDYTYVKGFIIPAGDYSTPRTFTLNNVTILGNTNCQSDRTIRISIDSDDCNDLVQPGTTRQTTYTIEDDDTPEVNQPGNSSVCRGITFPATVFSGSTLPNTTYTWANNNTAIGLAASGTGNIPAFTTTNTTANPITATITVTPRQGTCVGTPRQFTITVNPTATVNAIANKTQCVGLSVPVTTLSSPTAGTTFAWTNSNTAIGLGASGIGDIHSFTATNTTTDPITATITVTPTYAGCVGTPRQFTITVNPVVTVNAIADKTLCVGSSVPVTTISSPTAGTTFTWTNTFVQIGLAASGTGDIPAFTATNPTANPIISTITITPMYAGCAGTPRQFTIRVNPTATVDAIADKTLCVGSSVPVTTLSSPTAGATFTWTNSNTAIGLAASGTGNIPSFIATNSTNTPITATITVTPTYAGCVGTPRQFIITVNPTVTVNTIADKIVCRGSAIPVTSITSPTTGVTFRWTNSNIAIGLAASGTGNIPSFTATNTTTDPITATITVTPIYARCVGTPRQFTITVNPVATVNAIANKTQCVGSSVPVTTISSPTAGTTFAWTNSNTAIGLAASGTGNIPSFTATNSTNTLITATITVTPTYAGCVGTPRQFTITINPVATVNAIANKTQCVGSSVPITTLSSPTAGTTFAWANSNTAIGLAASGTGNIPSFTATNTTTDPITATITVTPTYAGCVGTPRQFTITVNPVVTVNAIANKTQCVGSSVPVTTLSSPTAGTIFAWTNSNTVIGLAASGTGDIPAFTATNTTDSPITATITVTPTYAGCAGTPRQFTIKVYAPTNAGKIEGNPFVCTGVRPLVIKGQPSTGGSGSFTYQWQQSPNNSTWTDISGATGLDYTPPILASNTYFRRNTKDASCGTFPSNVFLIKVVATPTSLYWKSNAGDNNWNNPVNWVDKNGTQLGMVPLVCTEVHIPGGASKYPSLDGTNTPQGIYGKPVCQNIVYHFGGEVAYPQNLTYEKAYVQYNWGYYNKTSGIADNSQPTANVDGASAPKMQRGKWYALAAPLKKMASGDFALAGYPLTWQAVYNMANPATGILENIDFSKAFATNDVNLSKTNNTIAVKVAPYNNTTIGYNNQRHLESLKGVIEIPFFENKTQVPFRPGHQYDPLSKKSTFFYFDTKTLKQIYSPVGQMQRSNEAYRFIFENDNNVVGTISVGGVNVRGYQQRVTVSGTSKKVMVGNPFMASINAKNFYDANAAKLVSAEGYKVFSSTTQTWEQYPFAATNNVGPLQAFVVTLASGLNSADLLFPLEGNLALTGAKFKGSVQRSIDPNSLSVRSVDNQSQNTEYAVLSADYDSNVKKVVSQDGHNTPEAFFITSNNDYNLLQTYDNKEEQVRLGVKSSNIKDPITLEFGNVADFASQEGVHPILEDKLLNIKHDLLKNSNYRFSQQKLDSTSQYADVSRFVLRLPKSTTGINDDKENDKSIVVTYVRNELSVYADYYLSRVLVYDLKGYEIHNSGNLGMSSLTYVKNLLMPHGSYIVKVSTVEGKVATRKIITQQ